MTGQGTSAGSCHDVVRGPEHFRDWFGVSRETTEKLGLYADLLRRWQAKINLVAPATLAAVWHRHIADSAQVWPLIPEGALRLLDLGSGAGFPGLVTAIMAGDMNVGRAGMRHTLIESDSRKAAFLREVAREAGLAVDIVCMRIESAATLAKVGQVDCVTARALAPLPRLLSWARPYMGPDSAAVFLKGRDVASELKAAEAEWSFRATLTASRTEPDARLVFLQALRSKTEDASP